jgi:DNA-binding CsgD family transcriptional regulator
MEQNLDSRLYLILTVALLSIIVGGTADLVMDNPQTWLSFHVVFETVMIVGAGVMATTLWLGWWRSAHSALALRESLAKESAAREAWKASARAALEGLGKAIDEQFTTWRLTPTEREIALMLLKGYEHKQIAALTGRSERTVRQHAGVVYEKGGFAGRAELAAYFLHDLMLPEGEREAGLLRPHSVTAVDSSWLPSPKAGSVPAGRTTPPPVAAPGRRRESRP